MKRSPYISFNYNCNLACSYCSATSLISENRLFLMDPKTLEELVLWLKRQGVKHVATFGGEPTLHPQFVELIKVLARHGMKTALPTNGIFEESKREAFLTGAIGMTTIHINPIDFYSPGQYEKIKENIKFLAQTKDLVVDLRFVIDDPKIPVQEILNLMQETGIKNINFVFAKPESHKKNRYLSFAEIKEILPEVNRVIMNLREKGFNSKLVGLLPFCIISGYEDIYSFKRLDEGGSFVCAKDDDGFFDTSIVINPDLTAQVCAVLPITTKGKKMTDYDNLDEVKKDFEERFLTLQRKPIFEECDNCQYFNTKCQGGCLIYKNQD